MRSNLILSQNMIFKKFSAPNDAVLSGGGIGMGKKTRREGWGRKLVLAITHSSHWTVDYGTTEVQLISIVYFTSRGV